MSSTGEVTPQDGHSDYLVTSNGHHHLPIKKNGKISHRLMGAAWAALHGGYRGHKYEGPDKGAAIKKLDAAYKREGISHP